MFSDEEEEEEKKKHNDIRGGPRFGIRGDGIDGSTAHPRRRSVDARASKLRQFYKVVRRAMADEAALILGIRESAAKNKVMEAHRKVMMANHPDAGEVRS